MSVLRSMGRYGLKGVGTTSANVAVMTGLVELGGLRPAVAAVLSTCALLLVGYWLMNRWVFADAETPDSAANHLRRGAAYYSVILSGKGVNYALFLGLVGVGVWYPAAWLLGSVTVFVGTFSANRYLWHGRVAA